MTVFLPMLPTVAELAYCRRLVLFSAEPKPAGSSLPQHDGAGTTTPPLISPIDLARNCLLRQRPCPDRRLRHDRQDVKTALAASFTRWMDCKMPILI
ncbi:hypothetical protein AJ87_31780 [Rhizobium yanglingense]|nr:hypothetical protein AJ87_31780 [Rhizobium yanglingense]